MDTIEAMVAERPRAMDPEEWKVRVDLAACYRLIAHFGWDDLILTHNSARVPGTTVCNHAVWSPARLMVMRNHARFGGADSEKGWACHQPSLVRNRHKKN